MIPELDSLLSADEEGRARIEADRSLAALVSGRLASRGLGALRSCSCPLRYRWAGTAESLDIAARSYEGLGSLLPGLGQEELAVANLAGSLACTNRRWNSLDRILIPGVALGIRRVETAT